MNDLELCLEVVRIKVTSTVALHLTLNISETVRDRGLVPKDYQWEMAYGLSNGHVTDDSLASCSDCVDIARRSSARGR